MSDLHFDISKNVKHLLDVLKDLGGRPRFVGGMVRDKLAGKEGSDIDIATSLKPEEVIDALSDAKIKYVDTGSKHGTITAIIDSKPIEITTLRIDTLCDGRHAKVEFTDSFEEDARRRDFTINAMSYCPYEKKLYDYFGGKEDLKNKIVQFIGDPNERIIEDNLRILRFFRFSDRFAKQLDGESLRICINHKLLISSLSKERIKSEFDKIIISDTAHDIFWLMLNNNILEEILPTENLDLDLFAKMPNNINLRYAALFHNVPDLKMLLTNLKFSKVDIKQIIEISHFRNLYGDLSNSKNLKMIFYPLWIDSVPLNSLIKISNVVNNPNFKEIKKRLKSEPPQFPISGNDIVKEGIEGADIASSLEALKMKWIESNFSMNKSQLLAILR